MQQSNREADSAPAGARRGAPPCPAGLLTPERNYFVERPWGGMQIREYKRLCPLPDQPAIGGQGLGEAFEISAWPDDAEARAHPSRLRFADGVRITLTELFAAHADRLLGPAFVARHGGAFPLLPKTLDIKELLSVQGHPAGHTEAYIILAAEPGATIRLGFKEDIDPEAFRRELLEGRNQQRVLLGELAPDADQQALQAAVAPWLAAREAPPATLRAALEPCLRAGARWQSVEPLVAALKRLYWRVLDAMNALPVHAGQVIYNANPPRSVARGGLPAAEVHALGNPEGREILMLEVRRPGPTFRAWDNVRFPVRDVDVDAAVTVLNFKATSPADFMVTRRPLGRSVGRLRSVECEFFTIEHLCPAGDSPVDVESGPPHSLHAVEGEMVIEGGGAAGTSLARGESAIVPADMGGYRVTARSPGAELIRVTLPF